MIKEYVYLGKYSTYSLMNSDGNSFGGDVILESFNMVYTTVMKTAFKTKKMKRESFGIFIIKIFSFNND